MEVAKLLNLNIFPEEERQELEKNGLDWQTIERTLNNKYRIHSDKEAFSCTGCDKPVSMVLRKDKIHFRHKGDRCPSEDNYKQYIKKIGSGENERAHKIGKAILRTYLEGQLKIHGIEIKEGYSYRKTSPPWRSRFRSNYWTPAFSNSHSKERFDMLVDLEWSRRKNNRLAILNTSKEKIDYSSSNPS